MFIQKILAVVDSMNELIALLYNEYYHMLENLSIGYDIDSCGIDKVWEIIQVLYFAALGDPTTKELLWIADKYETSAAFLEDFNHEFD